MGGWVVYLSVRKLVCAIRTWVTEESMRREREAPPWRRRRRRRVL